MTIPAQSVERTRLYQRLEHLFIGRAKVNILAEIIKALELLTLVPRCDYLLHRLTADALNGRKTESNHFLLLITVTFIQRRKINPALIYIRRQNLNPHPAALTDIINDLIRITHLVRQQRRHKLDRPVRLHIRRLIRNKRIPRRVTLIETVPRKPLNQLEYLLGLLRFQSLLRTPLDESLFLLRYGPGLFLADCLNQRIRLPQRYVTEPVANPHHLLLVNHDAVRFFEHLFHNRMRQLPPRPVLAVNVISNQNHRPRPVQRVGRYQILNPVRHHLHQQILHPARLELEHSLRLTAGE